MRVGPFAVSVASVPRSSFSISLRVSVNARPIVSAIVRHCSWIQLGKMRLYRAILLASQDGIKQKNSKRCDFGNILSAQMTVVLNFHLFRIILLFEIDFRLQIFTEFLLTLYNILTHCYTLIFLMSLTFILSFSPSAVSHVRLIAKS